MRFFLVLSLILSFFIGSGQAVYTTKKDISDANEIIFYGYDFSHFKLADPKRQFYPENDPAGVDAHPGSKIKVHMSGWVGYLQSKMSDNYFAKKMKTPKVTFDFDYTLGLIRQLNDTDAISSERSTLPKDSIRPIISRYQVKQKEGIGLTCIVECFDKETESSAAYFIFFDIATRKVLMLDYFKTSHAYGFGLTNHWGYGFYRTVDAYISQQFKANLRKK